MPRRPARSDEESELIITRQQIVATARDRLGYGDLRPGQLDAVEAVVNGTDTLAVMPTGSGKSAIYQLAVLLGARPAVIVSPLISLQHDQLAGLENAQRSGDLRGKGAVVNSTLGERDRQGALAAFAAGDVDFLFLAPEQLRKADTVEAIARAGPGLFVVDEAHCISGWGHDFRPDYLLLHTAIRAVGDPVVLALTATAAPPVRNEILQRLDMTDATVVVRGFDRPNIRLAVDSHRHEESKLRAVVEWCETSPGPGMVYVATRRRSEELAARLEESGVKAAAYHAGLASSERERVHEGFLEGSVEVVVATIAFGMGIDKPDVRWVAHSEVSESLDAYYQEIGRGGRDGEPASAVLFYRPEDLGLRRFFAAGGELGHQQLLEVATSVLRRKGAVSPEVLREETGLPPSRLTAALTRLEEVGALSMDTDGNATALAELHPADAAQAAVARQEARTRVEQSRVDMMRGYAESRSCRRAFLLNYFGEPYAGPCGNCDVCERQADAGRQDEAMGTSPFAPDTRLVHEKWGEGLLVRAEGDAITVLFDDVGYKTLSLRLVTDGDLLRSADAREAGAVVSAPDQS